MDKDRAHRLVSLAGILSLPGNAYGNRLITVMIQIQDHAGSGGEGDAVLGGTASEKNEYVLFFVIGIKNVRDRKIPETEKQPVRNL